MGAGGNRRVELGDRFRRVITRGLVLASAIWALSAAAAWATPPNAPDPGTWGTDGRVWSIVQVGSTVFVGGDFTHAVAPDGSTVPRAHLMAIDAATGALDTSFSPDPNGIVYSLVTDGSQLFVGGDFITIDGQPRSHFAAYSGETLESWKAEATKRVRAMAVSGSTLYMGGQFAKINGVKRQRFAALDLSQPVPSVLPLKITVNAEIRSVAPLTNGQVVIGGVFATVNGTSQPYLAAINPDGSVGAWATHPAFQVWQVIPFGTDVFVAGGGTGDPDGHAYRFTNTGTIVWDIGSDGGVQAIDYDAKDGQVIFGGHFRHIGGVSAARLAAVNPATGAVDPGWTPKPNSAKGTWSIFVNSTKIYAGGDFTLMGTATFRHLARFSI
jgi:hypothetical protein